MSERSEVEPVIVQKRGIDVTPYIHGIWCSVGDSEPFVNVIERRSWSEDGSAIWFMLGTHNFYKCAPDEMMGVVERAPIYGGDFHAKCIVEDAERMAKRPTPPQHCEKCGQELRRSRVPAPTDESE